MLAAGRVDTNLMDREVKACSVDLISDKGGSSWGRGMKQPRIVPSIITALRVMSTTLRACAACLFHSRRLKDPTFTMRYAREGWGPRLFKISKADLNVSGGESVDYAKPHIYVMNHESYMDIPAAFMALPCNIGFIAKKELESVPFFGRTMREAGMIFVDRRNPEKAIASLKKGGALIRSGVNIFAFPEGTRTKDGVIKPFKKGVFMLALEAGVPIVPMAIAGAREVLPYGSFDPTAGTIKVRIGHPIETSSYSVETREALVEAVRNQVLALRKELDDGVES